MLGTPFERITINITVLFLESETGNQRLEVCTIPNQEVSTMTDALVTNFFHRFRVQRELHRN
jgi:hypothetical protein